MADQKISELNTITGANVADASDKLAIVDASGNETKAITRGELLSSVSQITTDTAGDSVAIKALRPNNSGTGNPVVIVAGDGDSGDVLVEMRGVSDPTDPLNPLDVSDDKESSQAQFIFYGNGASTFNGPLTLNSNATITGNLTVSGTTTTVDTTNLNVEDAVITLNTGQATPLNDVGVLFQRYASATASNYNVVMAWDESVDKLIFGSTAEDGSDNTITFEDEWMTITSGGNVGIGLSNPNVKLDVSGSVTSRGNLVVGSDTAVGSNLFVNATSNRVGINKAIPSVDLDVDGDAQVSGDFTVDTSTLHVDSTNNRVGIGTASPSTPLDIATSGYVKLLIDDGANIPFSVGTGANGISIENNTAANNTDEYITLFATDSSIRLGTNGSEAVRISSAGNVGIGTTTPSEKLDVSGNVTISGSLSKGSGSFKIDHPLKPETHHLVHSFVEAPQADNIYRGRVDLVDGVATVNLDEAGRMTEGTFVLLNGNIQCFTSNETDWCPVRGSVNGNILTIEAQDNTCTDTISWLVIGERIDQHMIDTNWTDENGRIIVEPEKVIMEPEEEVVV